MQNASSFLTDCHCHLSDERIFSLAEGMIARAKSAGVGRFVLAGTHSEEWQRQVELKKKFPNEIVLNFGIHPWWVEKFAPRGPAHLNELLTALRSQISLADGLGETGLDFAPKRDPHYFDEQERLFRAQIQLAREAKKPIVLHIVHAHEPAIKILIEEKANEVPLLVHSYSGNATQLKEYLKLGAFISYSGTIVREVGYEKVKKACSQTPAENILFETDSPDQSWTEPKDEGQPNEPGLVGQVYQAGAKLLNIPQDLLAQKVAENLEKIGYHRPS